MNMLIITSNYPNRKDPVSGVFIQRLVNRFSDEGVKCYVVSPQNMFKKRNNIKYEKQITENKNIVEVFFPQYIGGWTNSKFHGDIVASLGERNFINSILSVIKNRGIHFDIVYAHFIGLTAAAASVVGKKYNKPVFAACGESEFWTIGRYDKKKRIKALNSLSGIVSVSTENKNKLIELGVQDRNKINVFPNGSDPLRFYPQNKSECRKQFGFSSEDFIVGFAGYFIERKGPLRLSKAVEGLEEVKVAFAGKGEQTPNVSNMVLCRQITPNEMPIFLNAIDVFVLPTLKEGCCNAIVEAICCGTPVISSNRAFNDDILSDDYSIRINPESIDEIKQAIVDLYDNPNLLNKMGEAASNAGKRLNLHSRARNILKWIMESI